MGSERARALEHGGGMSTGDATSYAYHALRLGPYTIDAEPMEAVRHEPLAFLMTPCAKRRRVARALYRAVRSLKSRKESAEGARLPKR